MWFRSEMYWILEDVIWLVKIETWIAIIYCLGSLEIRKIVISFIIGYHNSKPIERDALITNVHVSYFQTLKKTKTVLSHLQDGVLVSKVCENLGIHTNQYYEYQKQAFSSLSHVFSRDTILLDRIHQREVDNLKSKLSQKDRHALEILGLKNGAKWGDIQKKFKGLVKKYHPDKTLGSIKYEDILKKITLAYSQLRNTVGKEKWI